jgi:hypothetical protein
MLPDKEQGNSGWEPPVPLVLSAWWDSPYLEKILRLDTHIHYAATHGVLDDIDTYLRGLLHDQWFYG